MMNTFEADYIREKACEAAYDNAATDAERQTAIDAHKALSAAITARGERYGSIYRIYETSRDKGNTRPDIAERHDYADEAALIESLREFGFDEFTFSSTWSGAVESAFEFTKHGAKLQGLVEINDGTEVDRRTKQSVMRTKPAYLFSLR